MNGFTGSSPLKKYLSWRYLLLALLALFAVVLIGASGAMLGYYASEHSWDRKARAVLNRLRNNPSVDWSRVDTHSLTLEMARFQIRFPDGTPPAAIEEIEDNLIIVSRRGSFAFMAPDHSIRNIDAFVPMNIAALRKQPVSGVPDFPGPMFRVLDLLSVRTAPGSYALYVSHERWTGRCVEFVVSRLNFTLVDRKPAPQGKWRDIWTAKPCVSPSLFPDPQYFWHEALFESGGRLALKDKDTLLVTTGDVDLDGRPMNGHALPAVSQDPATDFGKIIAVDLRTGAGRQLAVGLRNPQGLLVDSSQRIWETEHGPRGGDELNLIRDGANYGWPRVTYGLQYPYRERDPKVSYDNHEGYAAPVEAFVPSVGISQLIQPSQAHYPPWHNSLLASSLRGEAIYVMRLKGEEVVYVETIPIGMRGRDLIERRNGEIAIAGNGGTIIFVRPHGGVPSPAFKIADLRPHSASLNAAPSQVNRGAAMFIYRCSPCHTLNGSPRIGPALNGVVNRDIAGGRYNYSFALRQARGRWTPWRLRAFVKDPEATHPGTMMTNPGTTPDEADDIVAYLRTTK